MEQIKTFCQSLIGQIKTSTQEPLPSSRKVIGVCPLCQGDIVANSKAYGCSNWKDEKCNFVIWQKIAGKRISEKIVGQLLANGTTDIVPGFKSKAGKNFATALKIEKGKVVFDFERKVNVAN